MDIATNPAAPTITVLAADWPRDVATVEVAGRTVTVGIDWDHGVPFVLWGSSPTTTDDEDDAISAALGAAWDEEVA